MNKVDLGDRVRERVTSVEGIVTGRTEYLHGCVRVQLQPQGLHEGKPFDVVHTDEGACEILERAAYVPTQQPTEATGGPREEASRPGVTKLAA